MPGVISGHSWGKDTVLLRTVRGAQKAGARDLGQSRNTCRPEKLLEAQPYGSCRTRACQLRGPGYGPLSNPVLPEPGPHQTLLLSLVGLGGIGQGVERDRDRETHADKETETQRQKQR